MRPRPMMPTVLCERPWPHIHRGFHEVQPPLQGGGGGGGGVARALGKDEGCCTDPTFPGRGCGPRDRPHPSVKDGGDLWGHRI